MNKPLMELPLPQSTELASAHVRLDEETQVGNNFISNYPPYSFWTQDRVSEAHAALERQPMRGTALGIYLHIPFCRKRCHFCYFKVYTEKNSRDIEQYLDAAIQELTLYSQKPFSQGRKPNFLYFGGGTPSYISSQQLSRLVSAMRKILPWDEAEEITFECEPGTLTEGKLKVIRDLGVTRLSLGVENFDDHVLQINGRAHAAKDIERSYRFARSLGFPQINIDLIAGMMGESAGNWRECVRKTILCSPDSVTIYQMELPFNTTISRAMSANGAAAPVADWRTKREWVDYAFTELEKAGYHVASAYTAVKNPAQTRFRYRDLLWSGADMIGLGVASFSHVGGTHFQNESDIEPYMAKLRQAELPIYRAFTLTVDEVMIREFILQMKLGHVRGAYFRKKFGVNIQQRFAHPLSELQDQGFLATEGDSLRLNRAGLLRVDRLLHQFFLPQHRNARYT
jgi:oxygen-independent coproporphyrinogen-3 oxidase